MMLALNTDAAQDKFLPWLHVLHFVMCCIWGVPTTSAHEQVGGYLFGYWYLQKCIK